MPDDTNTPATETTTTPAATDAPLLGGAKSEPAGSTVGKEAPPAAPAKTEPAEVKYEFKGAPEGYDTAKLEQFAREAKIAPDVAQKLLERDVAYQEASRKALDEQFKELSTKGWLAELKADKDLGGKNWDQTVATIKRANDVLPNDIKAQIDAAGLGNHPILNRIMHHFGKGLKEDSFVRGNSAASDRTLAQRLYA